MDAEQRDAVMRNDFDSMTYTTFWETYIVGKPSERGWWDGETGTERPYKIKRRCLLRRNNVHICYIRSISPTQANVFYLRLLLKNVAARSFDDLKRGLLPDDEPFATFEAAAKGRGLVVDDNEAELCLEEAAGMCETPQGLRRLYCTLVVHLGNCCPFALLQKFHVRMSEDFLHPPPPPGWPRPPAALPPPAPQHPHDGDDLADDGHREPQHPRSAYNLLLDALQRMLEARGSTMPGLGLPEPLPVAGSRDILEEHRDEYTTPGGAGFQRARAVLEERLPPGPAQLNAEQRPFFWDVVKRLRRLKRARGLEWDDDAALQVRTVVAIVGSCACAVPRSFRCLSDSLFDGLLPQLARPWVQLFINYLGPVHCLPDLLAVHASGAANLC